MEEKRRFVHSLVFPLFFLCLVWAVFIVDLILELNLHYLGLFPMKLSGLPGILTAPLVHSGFKHIFDNSLPLFILSLALFYFYRNIAYRVFFLIYLVTGFMVWLGARGAYHVGASGLVYGLAFFIFFSGVLRNNIRLLAISLLVAFLYGSLVWGLLPHDARVSWESHLFGAITGTVLAFYYRKYGPKRKKYSWELAEEEEDSDYWNANSTDSNLTIVYKKDERD